MPYDNPLALGALASIIPLILLYLLRPKPLQVQIPSLMFLMDIKEEKKRFYTSITKLIKDPLFLIQLLVLILLALAAASPFLETQEALSGEHTVLIIDASASMQTDNRFSEAISKAEGYVSKKNSIILAQSTPVTILESESSQATYDTLDTLKAKATVADLSSAISAGMRLLSDEGGNIVVVSDFTNWNGDDPVNAMNLAESYGLTVQFVLVGRETDNIGFIQGSIEAVDNSYTYTGVVKNYMNSRQVVDLEIKNLDNGKSNDVSLNIPAHSTKQFQLTNLGTGITEVAIADDDSLMADNTAYISIPRISDRQLLFVTDVDNLPSQVALSLIPNIKLNQIEGVPEDLSKYSMVVIANKERPLASNEIATLDNYLSGGGRAVFIASEALSSQNAKIELQEILPVIPASIEDSDYGVTLEVVQETRLSEDIKYEEVAMYRFLNVSSRIDSTTLVATDDNIPLLAYDSVGDGTVVYLGINDITGEDAWNNFYNKPEYPVFWFKLAGWLGGTGSVQDYNLKTGTISALAKEQDIQTPNGTQTVSRVLYDETGTYQVAGKEIAVNLYNDRESDTTIEEDVIERSQVQEGPEIVRSSSYTAKNYLDIYMIIIVFILVVLELLIIRKRGEL
ncbi:BatA domain-containing protein [Methanolobus sp. ZRKC5]|uniref:DUF7408 domain-containing protein n=1 Tax=Methanolobus sp. ZRKC5 TaxID=3136295 RepID=UPI00313B7220